MNNQTKFHGKFIIFTLEKKKINRTAEDAYWKIIVEILKSF